MVVLVITTYIWVLFFAVTWSTATKIWSGYSYSLQPVEKSGQCTWLWPTIQVHNTYVLQRFIYMVARVSIHMCTYVTHSLTSTCIWSESINPSPQPQFVYLGVRGLDHWHPRLQIWKLSGFQELTNSFESYFYKILFYYIGVEEKQVEPSVALVTLDHLLSLKRTNIIFFQNWQKGQG